MQRLASAVGEINSRPVCFDRLNTLSAKASPLIKLGVHNPKDCGILARLSRPKDLPDVFRVGGKLSDLSVSFFERNADECAVGTLKDAANVFWCWCC